MIDADLLTSEVMVAVEEVRLSFPTSSVTARHDPDGGAWVVVDDVDIGPQWEPTRSWLAFHIAAAYPYADVYPHFMDGKCQLTGGGLPTAVTTGASFPGCTPPCLQISRRSSRWNGAIDSAALKALKIVEWLRTA